MLTLLRHINRIGATSKGSDEKKSHMLTQLKSSIVYYSCPLIFLTLNPGERYSPLALFYAGKEINLKTFNPECWTAANRLKVMMDNPLAMLEYFHTTISTIIEGLLKQGLFGKMRHYYGTIEYQGRGSPHIHLAVHSKKKIKLMVMQIWIDGTTTPAEMRDKAKVDADFCMRLLHYISSLITETLPPKVSDDDLE